MAGHGKLGAVAGCVVGRHNAAAADAKRAGWFSRRHRTSDEHRAAVHAHFNTVNENKAPKGGVVLRIKGDNR